MSQQGYRVFEIPCVVAVKIVQLKYEEKNICISYNEGKKQFYLIRFASLVVGFDVLVVVRQQLLGQLGLDWY